MINSPLPRTYQSQQVNNTISGAIASLIFCIALAFKFASIISFIVKEREERCKHQQIVSGMRITSYWIGNFLYDMFFYSIIAVFAATMCMAFEIKSLTEGDALSATWLLFILFGLANIPFSYVMSFLFHDYGNSQAVFYFLNFATGGIVSSIILILRNIEGRPRQFAKSIMWPLRIIPSFSFGEGLSNIGSLVHY